jgi:hypothetical protein
MWWIVFVVLQGVIIWSGIRREERAGLWSWSKFAFALGFAGNQRSSGADGHEEPLLLAGLRYGMGRSCGEFCLVHYCGAPLEASQWQDIS